MILVFDTETNGMILNWSSPPEEVEAYPRLSQLSYNIYDKDFNLVKSVNNYVTPDGWDFPDEPFFREHADINKNRELGKPISEVLEEFISDRVNSKYVVAHNINFDVRIIRSEMIRNHKKMEFSAKKICTMYKSTSYCKLPHVNGKAGFKWPNLTELHKFLFNDGFQNAHNSLGDVEACAKCFFELVKRKVITLD